MDLDFKNLVFGNPFLSMRHISNMVTTGMVSHNFDYFLGVQKSMRENSGNQSVSLG